MEEEKKDEEEAEPVVRKRAPQRRCIQYFQPLNRDAILSSAAARRHTPRNRSLDKGDLDNRNPSWTDPSVLLDPSTLEPFLTSSLSPSSSATAGGPAIPNAPHPDRPRHRQSSSTEEIQVPQHAPPHSLPVNLNGATTASLYNCFPVGLRRAGLPQSDGDGGSAVERGTTECGDASETFPDFMGSGGGVGIFRPPPRAAMHPERPPALEVRPHPLRETQASSFLRTIACAGSQLLGGFQSGLRVWNLKEVFESWGSGAIVRRGDEKTAPFRESCRTSPTLCLMVDATNGLIWSGHKDGKIRAWKMDQSTTLAVDCTPDNGLRAGGGGSPPFNERLAYQAHNRSAVLSMVVTSYGEIWSGSEGGAMRVWPWEALEKALSLSLVERQVATCIVEKSYIDLRSRATVGSVCNIPTVDVRFMVSDRCRCKVWTAGSIYFALWDSRTRELLRVLNTDGLEARLDLLALQDPNVEDEAKTKVAPLPKKEKSQAPVGFFQRSRNVLFGAADVVLRVAAKGSFCEDYRRTEALAVAMDGIIWTGCANGSLGQWDGNGNRLQEFQHHSSAVQCICTHGPRVWVGYVSGKVQVLDVDGNLLGEWTAHSSAVITMAVGGSYIFTLAHHGGIRGWNIRSPGYVDDLLVRELANRKLSYTKLAHLKILVGTWNVAQGKATQDSLTAWLCSAASEVELVVVGLQEVEMGAGSLAMAAAKETVGLEGSANGQWWLNAIGKALGEGTSFQRVGSRQLAGLLVAAWCTKTLLSDVGDVDAAAVPCGFGRAIGNKLASHNRQRNTILGKFGAVGLRMRIYDRSICFVNCHFAAHLEGVSRRNADFDHIYRTLSFSRPTTVQGAAAGPTSVELHRGVNPTRSQTDDGRPDLSDADLLVFLGDFNYRLNDITYEEAREMVSQRCFDWLRDRDQLREEMTAGRVFQGMREGKIKFPPTYKFDRHKPGLSAYDSSEKKRTPAWCDRVLYRDGRSASSAECSLDCPIISSICLYDACMEVTESDHKPVRCMFSVDIAYSDELIRRQEYGEIIASNDTIRSFLEESCAVPDTAVSTKKIFLKDYNTATIRITNKGDKFKAVFQVICEGQTISEDENASSEFTARCNFGFPFWLEVHPAVGIIYPGKTAEICFHHAETSSQDQESSEGTQTNWSDETMNKEVLLAVNITGTASTQNRRHQVYIRHSFSHKPDGTDRKNARKDQASHQQMSDGKECSSSSDVAIGHSVARGP